MSDPMLPLPGLSPVSGKTIVAKFDGGLLSSDGEVGASLRYLPSYSPDLNPIEQTFAKLKSLCKKPPPEPSKPSSTP